jgi:hypothetical protein
MSCSAGVKVLRGLHVELARREVQAQCAASPSIGGCRLDGLAQEGLGARWLGSELGELQQDRGLGGRALVSTTRLVEEPLQQRGSLGGLAPLRGDVREDAQCLPVPRLELDQTPRHRLDPGGLRRVELQELLERLSLVLRVAVGLGARPQDLEELANGGDVTRLMLELDAQP